MPAERLQKVLAAAGIASRRGAEALIANGRVTVDGRPAKPGSQADPDTQIIAVDGKVIGAAAGYAHLVLHKPMGVTSTTRDPHADRTVLDLVPTAMVPDGTRLYPVGRLDLDSEGMLLLTNDGPWADRILHPRHGVEREYALGLERGLDADQIDLLRAGIQLDEGLATLINLRQMTNVEVARLVDLLRPTPPELHWYRATLTQGWKRQLRRMFGAVGSPVQRLVRVRIGPVRIDGLKSGSIRPLKAPEVRNLGSGGGRSRAAVAAGAGSTDDAPDPTDGAATGARPASSARGQRGRAPNDRPSSPPSSRPAVTSPKGERGPRRPKGPPRDVAPR